MARRPVFVPRTTGASLVSVLLCEFKWHPGWATSQKRRNIAALHAAARRAAITPVLEVSTKSATALGKRLSAFNLKTPTERCGEIPIECAFQGSKVFENGGPYTDLYSKTPREARRDTRLRASGPLLEFSLDGTSFPTEPKTMFYDWIYLRALWSAFDRFDQLCGYAGFTDIEFNPKKSLNCQARSCALSVALYQRGLLAHVLADVNSFLRVTRQFDQDSLESGHQQQELF